MNRRTIVCFASLMLLIWFSTPADATPVTWNLSGTMSNGETFDGRFTFEVTALVLQYPQTFFTVERSSYYRAITDLSFRIGNDTFTLANSPAHNTIDVRYAMTSPNPAGDALLIDADVVSAQYDDALSLSLFFAFYDPSGAWLTSGSLPPPPPDLSKLTPPPNGVSVATTGMLFRYQDANSIVHDLTGQITAVTVPEPTSLLLLTIGLAGMIAIKRKRRLPA